MELDRDTVVQAVASGAIVLLFIVAIFVLGSTFYTDEFSSTGALAIVGAIVGFVIVILGVGYAINQE